MIFNLKNTYCDSPAYWQISLQEPTNIIMEGILLFNKHLLFLLTVNVIFVTWLLAMDNLGEQIANSLRTQLNIRKKTERHRRRIKSVIINETSNSLLTFIDPGIGGVENRFNDYKIRQDGRFWINNDEYDFNNLEVNRNLYFRDKPILSLRFLRFNRHIVHSPWLIKGRLRNGRLTINNHDTQNHVIHVTYIPVPERFGWDDALVTITPR